LAGHTREKQEIHPKFGLKYLKGDHLRNLGIGVRDI